MRVIDLLNKIANGEEVPEKIRIAGSTYILDNGKELCYKYEGHSSTLCFDWYIENRKLNEEVEIIEEDKEIEHYDMFDNFTGFGFGGTDKELLSDLQNNFEHINEELDYLIKAVNDLKKGKQNMTEKELSKYYYLTIEIKDIEERIAKFGNGVGSKEFDNEISGTGKKESIQEKYMELKSLYIEKRIDALEEYIKIEKYISDVEDPEIRLIMRLRFMDLKDWDEIGAKLNYDRTSISKKVRRYIKSNIPTIPMKK